MNTELLSAIPVASVRRLIYFSASAPLRVFLAIAIAATNGVAVVSATELASLTGLTERSVFSALAYLEQHGFIARESRGPGPFANVVRIVGTEVLGVSTTRSASAGTQNGNRNTCQDEAENILDLVAACYRPLNEVERRRADTFFKDEFDNCGHIRPVLLASQRPGIAAEATLELFFAFVRAFHVRLYADTCSLGTTQ
jgi:hypothetical protein